MAGQLGCIVSWRVPASVELQALRRALRAVGLDEALASDMSDVNALRRALRDMRAGRVIRKLRREGAVLRFQLTREHIEAQRATYDPEAWVELDTETGAISCDVWELLTETRRLLADHQAKRLTSDLTRLVQRVFEAQRAALVPVRDQGGCYFVPDSHADLVESVRGLLTGIGGKLRSFAVRLGCDETAASVADSLAEYLQEAIQDFRAKCIAVSADSRSDVGPRRMNQVAELRTKLEAYQGLMGGYVEQIGEEIVSAEAFLMERLMSTPAPVEGDESAPAAPAPTLEASDPIFAAPAADFWGSF